MVELEQLNLPLKVRSSDPVRVALMDLRQFRLTGVLTFSRVTDGDLFRRVITGGNALANILCGLVAQRFPMTPRGTRLKLVARPSLKLRNRRVSLLFPTGAEAFIFEPQGKVRLRENPGGDRYLIGESLSYVDLSLFQVIAGLTYAFPRLMARLQPACPKVTALHQRVMERPRIAAYLASGRRIPFNQHGLFRHYPELDEN